MLYVHRNRRLVRDESHLDFHTAPEFCDLALRAEVLNATGRSVLNVTGRSVLNIVGRSVFNVAGKSVLNVTGRSVLNVTGRGVLNTQQPIQGIGTHAHWSGRGLAN